MSVYLFVEGGTAKGDPSRSRRAFVTLLKNAGFAGRMPALFTCGPRHEALKQFRKVHLAGTSAFLLIDSEDPVDDPDKTWAHLKKRDDWDRPSGATDEQVLFMTTSMETWIAADRSTLRSHYGHKLQESALPPTDGIESRGRHEVHDKLVHATRDCSNKYSKGKRSFEILGKLDPEVLAALPGFARAIRILKEKL